MATINARIQLRRDTAANWSSVNPVLLNGEIGYVTDQDYFKIGDGATAWNSLGIDIGLKVSVGGSSPYNITSTTYTIGISDLFNRADGYRVKYSWTNSGNSSYTDDHIKFNGDDLTGFTIDGINANTFVNSFRGIGTGYIIFRKQGMNLDIEKLFDKGSFDLVAVPVSGSFSNVIKDANFVRQGSILEYAFVFEVDNAGTAGEISGFTIPYPVGGRSVSFQARESAVTGLLWSGSADSGSQAITAFWRYDNTRAISSGMEWRGNMSYEVL